MNKFALLILFFSYTLQGIIIESSKIEIIKENIIDKQTLVAFDIDNTIMEPENEMGSDQWFDAMVQYEKIKNPGINTDTIVKRKVLPLYYEEQRKAKVKLVEPEIVNLIKSLQEKGIPTIGLTLRGISILGLTRMQLLSLCIDFTNNNLTDSHIVLDSKSQEPAVFYKGILYTNGNVGKYEVLKAFLQHINFWPKKIIVIDDKLKYLIDLQRMCDELNIEFIGIRYSYCDEKVRNFKLDHNTIVNLN